MLLEELFDNKGINKEELAILSELSVMWKKKKDVIVKTGARHSSRKQKHDIPLKTKITVKKD